MLEFFIWSLLRYFIVNFIDFGKELPWITRLCGQFACIGNSLVKYVNYKKNLPRGSLIIRVLYYTI